MGEFVVAAVVVLAALPAQLAAKPAPQPNAREIRYVPPASWVRPPPQGTQSETPASAPIRFIYSDQQFHLNVQGQSTYTAQRYHILKPEALASGNLSISWNPDGGSAEVHKIRLFRDGVEIDVLAKRKFDIIQRESGLDAARITGILTATLQVPGLRVGDQLEFAVTIHSSNAGLGNHVWGLAQLPLVGVAGTFRTDVVWSQARKVTIRTTPDLVRPEPEASNAGLRFSLEQRDPKAVVFSEGVPMRYNLRRLVQYSDFAGWDDVSSRFLPLFSTASAIPANSPLRAEIARIAAASSDPAERARQALRLVQNDVRYVFVGLNGGNYRPMTADETWEQRYGDCKAKTALLLGLLRELGIVAEAVLVSSNGGDGTDQFLASPAPFDHVLVRAKIAGKSHWLDGVRLGDSSLDALATPPFRWALALRSVGAALEEVPIRAPERPLKIQTLDMDASMGPGKPSKVRIVQYLRGDFAQQVHRALGAMSAEDGEREIRQYWRSEEGYPNLSKVGWSFDDAKALLTVSGEGETLAEDQWWDGPGTELQLMIPGAGFTPPSERKRPADQDSTLPWSLDFPAYSCWAVSLHLPKPVAGHGWEFKAKPVDRTLGGVTYWRRADLRDGAMRTIMARRTDAAEITAAQAAETNAALAKFDNAKSLVFQRKLVPGYKYPQPQDADRLQLVTEVDWKSDKTPCTLRPAVEKP